MPGILYSLCTLGVSHCRTLCSRSCHCSWPHLPRSCVAHNKACVCESCSSMQNSPQHNQTIVIVIHILYTNNLGWNDMYAPCAAFIFIFYLNFFYWCQNPFSDIRHIDIISALFSFFLMSLNFRTMTFPYYSSLIKCKLILERSLVLLRNKSTP